MTDRLDDDSSTFFFLRESYDDRTPTVSAAIQQLCEDKLVVFLADQPNPASFKGTAQAECIIGTNGANIIFGGGGDGKCTADGSHPTMAILTVAGFRLYFPLCPFDVSCSVFSSSLHLF